MLSRLGFTGRLMAIVLLALLALTASVATLGYIVNWQRPAPESWAVLPERAAAVVDLLDHAEPRQRALILKAVNSENTVARLTRDRPLKSSDPARLTAVEWVVAQYLREVGNREVIALVEPGPPTRWRDFKLGQLRMFAREPLRIAIALADGHWIVFETRVEISSRALGIPPGFVIGAIGALVGIASILAIAREAKPLGELASSVTLFGKDAVPKPVSPRGAPEIAGLIRSVNDMQARIAALLKGRTVMLGAISHDLKTFITRLRLRAESIADEEQRAKATKDLDDMTALIDDALAIARGSALRERHVPIELVGLLEAELADRPTGSCALSNHGGTAESIVDGDPVALRRVFGNLIDNALQYGATARVTVTRHSAHVAVTIDDDGPGIPQDERVAVFEPFYRLDSSRSRSTGGSGLGLAIAREIVTAHGGQVYVTQSPLGGARLNVELPV